MRMSGSGFLARYLAREHAPVLRLAKAAEMA
jgi:hypothetical protein